MSYLEELIAKATKGDLWDSPYRPPVRSEKNGVETNSFDKMNWAYVSDQIPALSKQVDDLGADFETSPWAYEDLFALMHKTDPRPTPADLMEEKFLPQAFMMNTIGACDEIRHLRHETVLDEYNTAFAMLTMRDKMRKAFEDMQSAMDAADEANQALTDALAAAQDALASGEGVQEAAEALEAALAGREAAQGDAEGEATQAASTMADAAKDAADAIEAERAMFTAYGVGPGQLQKMSFEERRTLAERLTNSRVSELAKLIGAQRLSADAESRRSIRFHPTRTADMRLGNELEQMLPSEAMKLAIPELEEDWWIRWSKKRLRLKKWIDPPRLDRGPIIVVCDESYSMNAPLNAHGTREAWSKAISLALCDQARRGKRDFIYIGFASAHEVWTTQFAGGVTPIEGVMEFTEHFFAGGTSYERPLSIAMGICKEYAKIGKARPDIVFLTDDECRVPEQFIEQWKADREETQTRCYGIQVGGSGGYDTMRHLTDQHMDVNALNAGPDGMTQLFRSM